MPAFVASSSFSLARANLLSEPLVPSISRDAALVDRWISLQLTAQKIVEEDLARQKREALSLFESSPDTAALPVPLVPTRPLNPLAAPYYPASWVPGDHTMWDSSVDYAPPRSAAMHGGAISRALPSLPVNVNVSIPGLQTPVNHTHTSGNAPFSLQHTINLDPATKSYMEMVGAQVVCSSFHLMLHTSIKGVIWTVLEFLYKVCSPLLSQYSVSSIFSDYVWPLVERFSTYIASKVRNAEVPEPGGPIPVQQHSGMPDSWAEMVPLGAGLASIVAALVCGSAITASSSGLREYKAWTDYGAGLGKIKTAISTVTEFAQWVIEHTRTLMMSYFPEASVSSSLQTQFLAHNIDVSQYMRDVAEMTNPNNADAVLRHPDTPAKLVSLCQKSAQVLVLCAENKVVPGNATSHALTLLRRELLAFAQNFSSSRAAMGKRPTPYHVSIFGRSGVGKSDMVQSLIYDLTDPTWFKTEVDRDSNGRITIYPRSAADPYWSNYAGQGAVILDDFGQSAQDTVADSEYLSLIFMITGTAFMPRMAAVADKGRLFTSRLVVSTTNNMFPTSLCVKTNEALWRRRNILVEAKAVPGTALDDENHLVYDILDPCPMSPEGKAFDQRRCIQSDLTYNELVEYIVPKFNAFCERDERAVLRLSKLSRESRSALASRLAPSPPVKATSQTETLRVELKDLTKPKNAEMHNGTRPLLPMPYPTPVIPEEGSDAEFEDQMYRWTESHGTVSFGYCHCCDYMRLNHASICCTVSDVWHPFTVGVPIEVFSCPVVTGACAQDNHSQVTRDFFLHDFDEVTDFHKYAVLQALQVQDIILDFGKWTKQFTNKDNKFLARFHTMTENRLRLPDDDSKPVGVLWKDMKKVWKVLQYFVKHDLYQWFEASCPPRINDYYAEIQRFADCNPTPLDYNSLQRVEMHAGEVGHGHEYPDNEKLTLEVLSEGKPEVRAAILEYLPFLRFKEILRNASPKASPSVVLMTLHEAALLIQRQRRTAEELLRESDAICPDNIEATSLRERMATWMESAKTSPLVKRVFQGLGAAATAIVCYRAYKWLTDNTETHTLSQKVGEKTEQVRVSITQNFSGFAQQLLLSALVEASAIAAGHFIGAANMRVNQESFGYDGRARFLRQGKIIRASQHDLEFALSCDMENLIDVYADEMGKTQDPEWIERFKNEARRRITKSLAKSAEVHGSSDNRTQDVLEYKVKQKNLFLASRTRTSGKPVITNGFGLKGKLALLPFHMFHDMTDGDQTELTVKGPTGTYTVALVMGETIRRCTTTFAVASEDLAIVWLGARVPSFYDITKFFVSDEDVQSMYSTNATVVAVNPHSFATTQHLTFATRDCQAITYGDEFADYVLPRHWTYGVSSYPGMCGALVACLNTQSSGCIMGMHTAGIENEDQSYAAIVTKEWLALQLQNLFPKEASQHCGPMLLDGPLTRGLEKDLNFSDVVSEIVPKYPTIEPEGQVKLHAYLDSKHSERVTAKTDLKPSPLFDRVVPHETEPAVLHPNDPRLEKPVFPMNEGAKKYSSATKPQNPLFIKRAFLHILSVLQCYTPVGVERRVLTVMEGINGLPFAGLARINPLTSPGLPFKWWKPAFAKGKRFLFTCDGDDDRMTMTPKDAYLIEQLEAYHSRLLAGKQTFLLSYSNLKDERRSLAKIKTGATRLFDCMPLHFNIECRRFFGAFIACMNQNCTKLPSAVGLNPLGPDWTAVYNRLNRFGGQVIAGDYIAWDGKLDPDVMFAAVELINQWYDDGPENARARHVLVEQMIHLLTVYGNVVALKSQGLPSGVPITADINGLCNWFYILICLQSVAAEKGIKLDMDTLSDQLELLFYGDDHLIAASAEIREWFSFHDVRRYFTNLGMGYTDAQKKGGDQPPFQALANDATFLKRTFSPHPKYRTRVLAPIEKKTIHEEINWLRTTTNVANERELMYQNLNTALSEAYHHGYSYYTSLQSNVNHCLLQFQQQDLVTAGSSDWRTLTTDCAYYDECWLDAFA